ncbi:MULTISPECIES: sodium-dependent transporter [Moorena]|uniref:Transporter n=1 Tax=Moorena producens 3L TaxID=489825 RepID=F4XXP1_9CYAN|nr:MULTISPECIES: sodium-dependent transporter [Moorena]NEQ17029.1 sodium-dependent transporter [Moorena sp. SIO3E2]EGJ30719.1 Na+-dependent transporter, SNF family [Moorena producens 3L]NEP35309.1 sodium-dependent transporter [Moorena sp. SIO3B2]NEP69241.1 sodium-dependent transporter [Moorena sp. SIO3A5]NEQ07302.1 sodium-dependent transporter [Moorena sp. SIO4E2]
MARQRWASRTVFLLAAVGSAVGLGNVWRFPYLAGKYGGGAFLVPYLIALVLIGVPLLMLEFAVGQKMQRGAIGSFRKLHPNFGSLGLFALMSAFIIVSYYAVVMGWSLIYFLASFGVKWSSDAKSYFFDSVLQISDGVNVLGGINWPILWSLLVVWVLIYFCVWKGTTSVGKVVVYSVPLPIILLGVLLLRAVTLPGFLNGWKLYLTPVWSALVDPEVWTAAFSQIFFTLSLGFGIMVTYASYKNSEDDIAKDTWLTALINSGISLFAGFVVFGILGYMAGVTNTPLAELAASGPGLAFVVFPEALSLMPLPWLFSLLFFVMLLSLGIDSAFSLVEALNATILDKQQQGNVAKVSIGVCLGGFIAGIIYTTRAGLYILDIVDHFVTNYNLMLVAIFQSILVGWVYGAEKLRRYMNQVSDWTVGKWWNFSIKYLIPMALVALLATQFSKDIRTPYEGYPAWALGLGWAIVFLPLLIFLSLLVTDKTLINGRTD